MACTHYTRLRLRAYTPHAPAGPGAKSNIDIELCVRVFGSVFALIKYFEISLFFIEDPRGRGIWHLR